MGGKKWRVLRGFHLKPIAIESNRDEYIYMPDGTTSSINTRFCVISPLYDFIFLAKNSLIFMAIFSIKKFLFSFLKNTFYGSYHLKLSSFELWTLTSF